MKKLTSLVMTLVMLLGLVFAGGFEVKAESSVKTFDFSQMNFRYQVDTKYSVTGTKLNATFSGLWNEIQFALPEPIDVSMCSSVTFSGNCKNGRTCFKLYNTDNEEVAAQYDFQSNGECTFSTDTGKTNTLVDHIGIMSKEEYGFSVTMNSVKFKVNSQKLSDAKISKDRNLLTTYGQAFKNVGCAVSAAKLSKKDVVDYIKREHNSVTPGNEMKPDSIMYEDATIPVSEAKELGYYIPEGYTEKTVPKLNFYTVDNMLKTAYENGLTFRAHTLVWHQQTPDRFFKEGFSSKGAYVSKDVMTKRMEFYIKSVMNHVYDGKYSSVIYAWDVVNEYTHAEKSGWLKIYGDVNSTPDYVKNAFKFAYEELEKYNVQDNVKLFYNDYNTYQEKDKIISLIKFINAEEKICAGVGMQSHLATNYPWAALYKETLQAFVNEGFEVQISELDVTCEDLSTQAKYYYDLMSSIMEVKKASDADASVGKITALIFWGVTDEDSWRSDERPLLYSDYFTAKPAYEQCLKAFEDSDYKKIDNKLLDDVNGDGTINLVDYAILRKHINTNGKYKINKKNSDLNDDGKVDFLDLILLKNKM